MGLFSRNIGGEGGARLHQTYFLNDLLRRFDPYRDGYKNVEGAPARNDAERGKGGDELRRRLSLRRVYDLGLKIKVR